MELASRVAQNLPKSRWMCSQCRQASNLSEPRYSTKTATASLADDLLRPLRKNGPSPPRPNFSNAASRSPNDQQAAGNESQIRKVRRRAPSMMDIAEARSRERRNTEAQAANSRGYTGAELERQISRRFNAGDVYSPHDLNGIEQSKWAYPQAKPRTKIDIVDRLGVDFMKEYKNFGMMQEFVTPGGRIKPSSKTGLRPKNQRRLARAVRRASGLGLIPKTYPHPELLLRERNRR